MSISVELFFAPGCAKCATEREKLKSVAEAFPQPKISWREVSILEEVDYAVKLGLLAPPAIAIDGDLVFPSLPTSDQLREELIRRLTRKTF